MVASRHKRCAEVAATAKRACAAVAYLGLLARLLLPWPLGLRLGCDCGRRLLALLLLPVDAAAAEPSFCQQSNATASRRIKSSDQTHYLASSSWIALASASDAGFWEPLCCDGLPLCLRATCTPAPAGLALAFGCAIAFFETQPWRESIITQAAKQVAGLLHQTSAISPFCKTCSGSPGWL